jgi:hypothetical protein
MLSSNTRDDESIAPPDPHACMGALFRAARKQVRTGGLDEQGAGVLWSWANRVDFPSNR